MNCAELRTVARELGIRGWSNAKKADLLAKIEAHKSVKDLAPQEPETVAEPKKAFEVQTPEVLAEADAKPKNEPTKASKKRKKSSWDAWLAEQRKEKGLTLKQATQLPREEYAKFKESWKPAEVVA